MEKFTNPSEEKGLNLKATELRLGLPGCESPEREAKGFITSGAKRVFSDTVNVGSGKWVFAGSEEKNGGFLSPRGVENGMSSLVKECVLSPKAVVEKKPQVSAAK